MLVEINGSSNLHSIMFPSLFYCLPRLFEWIFFNVHSEEVSDDERAVYLNGLHEVLANDGGKSPHTQGLPVSIHVDHIIELTSYRHLTDMYVILVFYAKKLILRNRGPG